MKRKICLLTALIAVMSLSNIYAVNFTPREIYSKDAQAVVFISAFEQSSPNGSAGTGSIITPEGKVLTNSHVITNPNTKRPYGTIVVCLKPAKLSGDANNDLKQCLAARVVARDPEIDLAVLQLENVKGPLPTMPVGDASEISTGDPVAAIGHPEGGGLWILTTGTISGVKKLGPQDVFQTEASINRGNSGGPLIDSSGNMIGINTSMSRRAADNIAIVGVNFAVKSTQVKSWLDSQGIRIALAPSMKGETVENVGLAPVDKGKAQQVKEPAAPPVEEKKTAPVEEVKPAPVPEKKAEAKPEVKQPEQTVPKQTEPKKKTTKKKPKSKYEQKMAKAEDELKEFKGPDGEIMYGIPGGKFSLNDTTKMLYDRTRKNAQKAFNELDEAE